MVDYYSFKNGITKVLIRLHGCTDWSAPLLLACNNVRLLCLKVRIINTHVGSLKCTLKAFIHLTLKRCKYYLLGKCCLLFTSVTYIQVHFRLDLIMDAKSMNPDQTALKGSV